MNVGVFGAERIGRMHLQNIAHHRQLNLQWIVENVAQAREAAKQELFIQEDLFRQTSDIPKLLDDVGTQNNV
jgi:predicted dehydrogenase